jgi:isovaleryl-CoA dehydrogenase
MDNEEWWPPEAFPQIGAAGFMGATVPTEYGGAGLDLFASRPGAARPSAAGTTPWR